MPPRSDPPLIVHVMTVPNSLRFLQGQVAHVREAGFRIAAVTSPGPLLDGFGAREGVEVAAVPMSRRIDPVRDLVSLFRLVRHLRRLRPDVVHAHTPKGGLLGMIAASIVGAPVRIYHVRGLPFATASGIRRRLLRLSEAVACRLAHGVLCVGRSVRRELVDEGLCEPARARVLVNGSGNGVDVDRFDPERTRADGETVRTALGIAPSDRVVTFVGRLVGDKGVIELADAWSRLRDLENVHLVVVGAPERRDAVPPSVLESLRGDPRVHMVGRREDMPAVYAATDVLALPTHREGFPNVLLEAAAMEVPVVSTRVTGPVDVVEDGATGALVPVADGSALAGALRRYLEDAELRRQHGGRARERVLREFRPEPIWAALVEYYRSHLRAARERGTRAREGS